MKTTTFLGGSVRDLDNLVTGLLARGGEIHHIAIGYGPTAAGLSTMWHALVIWDFPDGDGLVHD